LFYVKVVISFVFVEFVISFVVFEVCHQFCFMWSLSSGLFYVEFVISFVLCGVCHQFCFMWSLSSVLCGVCQKTFPIQNKKYLYNEACLNQIILMHYWYCQFCVVHSSPGLFFPSTFTFNTSLQISYGCQMIWFNRTGFLHHN